MLRIDIRDTRLRGGRINIAARTTKETVRRKREIAVRTLLERGDVDIVEALRARRIHITDVETAIRRGTVADLIHHRRCDTLGDAVGKFLLTVRGTRSDRTHRIYSSIAEGLLERFGATTLLDDVGKEAAEAYLHEPHDRRRKDGGSKPWAARHQMQTRIIAGRIWKVGNTNKNPWREAETLRLRKTERPYLTPDEWRTLLDAVRGTERAAMLALGTLAGLRLGEIRHLRTDIDVDLEGRQIAIQARQGVHAWQPKTDNSKRKVPICDELYGILAHHRERFAGERFFLRLPKADQPISAPTMRNRTISAFAAAGIRYGLDDGLTLHCTRHTFATWLLLGKPPKIPPVPVHVVAALMGDTTEVVLRTYAHLLKPNLVAGVSTLDAIVRR